MKQCTSCKEEFPATVEFFHARKASKDGLTPRCKECRIKDQTKYQQTERGKATQRKSDQKRSGTSKRNMQVLKAQKKFLATEKGKAYHSKMEGLRRIRKKTNGPVDNFYRDDVLDKWGMDCHICKTPIDIDNWHMEHVHPLAKGGSHTLENVKPSHPLCNLQKGAKKYGTI